MTVTNMLQYIDQRPQEAVDHRVELWPASTEWHKHSHVSAIKVYTMQISLPEHLKCLRL